MKSTRQLIVARMLSRDLSSVPCMLSSQSSQGSRSKTMRKYSKRKLYSNTSPTTMIIIIITPHHTHNFVLLCHSSCIAHPSCYTFLQVQRVWQWQDQHSGTEDHDGETQGSPNTFRFVRLAGQNITGKSRRSEGDD